MGYTHYFRKEKNSKGYLDALPIIKKILKKHSSIIQREYDDKKRPICNDEMVIFNGIEDNGHETFVFTNKAEKFNFCKTNEKPYDVVVCECLLVFNWFMPDLNISSDGMSGYCCKEPEGSILVGDCVLSNLDGYWSQAIDNVKEYGIFVLPVCSNVRDKYFDWEFEVNESLLEKFESEKE